MAAILQCFVKKNFNPSFKSVNEPRLLYVSKTEEEDSIYPRVMHAHEESVEIIFVYSGKAEYSIDGKKYYIKKGDIVIFNSGIVHDEISGPNIKMGIYCCAIGNIKLSGLRKNALIGDLDNPVFPSGSQFPAIESVFELMFSQLSSGSGVAEEVCHYLLMTLLSMVWNIIHKIPDQSNGSEEEMNILGKRIKNYIDKNYLEDITLQSISDALNVSPYYLSHVFKRMTGYSPLQYILRRRIGEAQTLLISTDFPITTIATKIGYNNPSHFNLLFTKNVGMSPRKYRINYITMKDKKL